MPVDTKHKSYDETLGLWQRCRDCYKGSDAVKAKSTQYLPSLDSHQVQSAGYDGYKQRALFYNATKRTVNALASMLFAKEASKKVPKVIESDLQNITLTGDPLDRFTEHAAQEIFKVGRCGILVEMASESKSGDRAATGRGPLRPYWVRFDAEDIVNWRADRVEGELVLTLVVLRIYADVPDADDEYVTECHEQYRVLRLVEGRYEMSVWEQEKKPRNPDREEDGYEETWVQVGETIEPTRRGERLTFIPFVFIGPTSVTPDVVEPPLLDLVDMNLSHYITMADLEHGRHFTALPTPWVSGFADDKKGAVVPLGSGVVWKLPTGGQAGMLEFSGSGLGALVTAEQDKRKMMATLAARILEDQPGVSETMGAVALRHTAEHATIKTISNSLEQAILVCLRWHFWWVNTLKTPLDAKPEELTYELNKEFLEIRATAQDVQVQLAMLQDGRISEETFYFNLTRVGWTRPGVTLEEEREKILEDNEYRKQLIPEELQPKDPEDPEDPEDKDEDEEKDGPPKKPRGGRFS